MEKISVRRPIGSTKIGEVLPGIGTVEDVFIQGDKDIRIVRHGDFGVVEAKVQQIVETAGERYVEPRVEKQTKVETITENVEMSAQEVETEENNDQYETDTDDAVEQETSKSKKSARKLKIAAQKKNKQVLDQSPMVDNNKQILRG